MSVWDPLRNYLGEFGSPDRGANRFYGEGGRRPGMFVARVEVEGKSMEPRIPDGSYCLFDGPVTGTRQGRIVLAKLLNALDPDTGQRFTVKRYRSAKTADEDGWLAPHLHRPGTP